MKRTRCDLDRVEILKKAIGAATAAQIAEALRLAFASANIENHAKAAARVLGRAYRLAKAEAAESDGE